MFLATDIDYGGSLFIKQRIKRNIKRIKFFAVIFPYLTSKTINLTTKTFLAVLKTFVGTNRQIRVINIAITRLPAYNHVDHAYITFHLIFQPFSRIAFLWFMGGSCEVYEKTLNTCDRKNSIIIRIQYYQEILNSRLLTALSSDATNLTHTSTFFNWWFNR